MDNKFVFFIKKSNVYFLNDNDWINKQKINNKKTASIDAVERDVTRISVSLMIDPRVRVILYLV